MNRQINVSFDFDGVLSMPSVEEFAKELLADGIDIWVTTSRYNEGSNIDLFIITERLGIPYSNIVFTSRQDKAEFLPEDFFVFHLDEDPHVINNIIENGEPTTPILRDSSVDWREMCRELIEFNLVAAFGPYIINESIPDSLEDLLANALDIEDYESAVILRDKIKSQHE
jgi:hypothetical protein